MNALKQLSLFSNQLEGRIPKSFRNMCNLKSLLLHNRLSGDFTEYTKNLSGCTEHSLESLVLDNNQIIGSIPDQIARFSSLTDLSLGDNRLNGTISESIAHLSELQILDLHGNFLKDSIPLWFWDLSPSSRYLNPSYNQISGILPDLSLKFVGFPGLDLRITSEALQLLDLSENLYLEWYPIVFNNGHIYRS
ncbi:hypothetical protein CRYUN_Cryun19dG0086400 [Craigia yunnanensis]